jgi:hypothetical protein
VESKVTWSLLANPPTSDPIAATIRQPHAHHDRWNAPSGGTIVSVDITPANAAGFDAHHDFVGRHPENGQVNHLKMVVFGKK